MSASAKICGLKTPETIAAALTGLSTRTILGDVQVRAADNQVVRGNYFGRVAEDGGILRPVISIEVPAKVAMPTANPACKL